MSLPNLLRSRESPFVMVRSDGRAYVFGGSRAERGAPLEAYDASSGSRALASPPDAIKGLDYATLLSGDRILLCSLLSCRLYVPALDQWQVVNISGAMTPLIPLKDGNVLRAGGLDGAVLASSASYLINPSTLEVQFTASMTQARAKGLMVRLLDGRVLAAGGTPDSVVALKSAEIFDPTERRWNAVAAMSRIAGVIEGVVLHDGRVLAVSPTGAEIYDPQRDTWTVVPGLSGRWDSAMALLPNGQVLISGGRDRFEASGVVLTINTIFDPATGSVFSGRQLQIPRQRHTATVLRDGRVLVIGGVTDNGVATSLVELFTWEPGVNTTFQGGYYVVSAAQSALGSDGFWGIEVHSSGPLDGGLNFGGLLAGGGKEVGFGAFYIAEPQTVSARVNLQALPGTTGPLEVMLNVLDVHKKLVAGPIQGLGNLNWSQALQPGFYVLAGC